MIWQGAADFNIVLQYFFSIHNRFRPSWGFAARRAAARFASKTGPSLMYHTPMSQPQGGLVTVPVCMVQRRASASAAIAIAAIARIAPLT